MLGALLVTFLSDARDALPQGGRSSAQGIGQDLIPIELRKPQEKAFGVTITVGVCPTYQ
jgi:hypothetical protein